MKKSFLFLSLLISSAVVSGQTSYYVNSPDNTKLHVQEYGHGKPVIILAGGPGLQPTYMEGVWEGLSSKYRCIVLDQRGTGKSILSSVDSASVNMKKYVEDLEALRKYLKLESLTLMGHSWGGMLAMEYAARLPEKTEKLILLDPGGPTSKFFAYFGDNIRMRLSDDDKLEEAVMDSMNKPHLKGIWPGYFFDRKRGLITKFQIEGELFGQPGISENAVNDFVAKENERARLLGNYKGVAYLIQGRQDPIGESTVYEIRDLLPQLQIHFIEKCGHLPWLENEAQVKEFFELLDQSMQ